METQAPAADYQRLPELLLEELKDVGVFLMDADRRITSWSPGIEHILGYAEEEFIGRDATVLFTPEDREEGADEVEFDKARTQGRAPDMRWHMRQDGSRVFVDGVLRAITDDAGTHMGYAKIMREIRPNRIGDSMLRAILDRTPDAIYIKDIQGRYVFANSETARIFGRSIEEVVGHECEEFLPKDVCGALREQDVGVIEGHSPRIVEELMITKEHGERTFLTGKAPWQDSEGKTIGVVSIAQDISARKAGEAERERLVRELRRSNDDLAQFAYVVSHDLQTPLRTIRSYTDLLARRYKGKLDDTADEFISIVLNGARNMQQLIESLLRYAQVGEETFVRTPVRIDAVLEGVRSNLQLLVAETSAKLTHGRLPTVVGDPVQLLQLFQNLISNAIKYSRAAVPPRIDVFAHRTGPEEYRFEIKDNGIGIDPNNFDRIFAPLKRLHGQEIPGSGIGLAVCKKIVERHGGRIWVTSEIGKGSTFYFTLPAE